MDLPPKMGDGGPRSAWESAHRGDGRGKGDDVAGDDAWLRQGFARIHPIHVTAFSKLLLVLRREFDGDIDRMLILSVISERYHAQSDRPELDSIDLDRFSISVPQEVDRPTVNVQSVADYSGIPRETVRRKVAALLERGWVRRDGNGDLHPTAKAASELRTATEATFAYIRTLVAATDAVRRDGG